MLVKTYTPKLQDIEHAWWIVDAEGETLGRLASKIAPILRGKHKPSFAPNLDVGDFVVVINVDKIVVTGTKLEDKKYYRHSGYPGGLTTITLRDNMRRFPDRPLREAVHGMLPKNALGRKMMSKLKIYTGSEHPHAAQKPTVLELK